MQDTLTFLFSSLEVVAVVRTFSFFIGDYVTPLAEVKILLKFFACFLKLSAVCHGSYLSFFCDFIISHRSGGVNSFFQNSSEFFASAIYSLIASVSSIVVLITCILKIA